MARYTKRQLKAMRLLDDNRGFGVDLAKAAEVLDTRPQSAAITMNSIVGHGYASTFVGGVGPQRQFWQAENHLYPCPHGCGPCDWIEDQWHCPKCGDEWDDKEHA